jgi:hypothetical protein
MAKTMLYQAILLISVFVVTQMSKTSHLDTENKTPLKCNETTVMKLLDQVLNKDVLSEWPLQKRFSSLNDLYLKKSNFWSVIKYENNKRLDRTARKVIHGETVNVVVYGGSNTAGGGLQEDENSIKGRFPNILEGWWKSVITPVTGSSLNVKIVGIGGTSSSYYQFCYKVYLDHNNVDLVILDSSVNDGVAVKLKNLDHMNESLPLEQFTRQLLSEPNHYAVMFVNFFLTRNRSCGCFNLMDLGQSLVTDLYNITTFNLRNLACEFRSGHFQITAKAVKHQAKDKYHMSLVGHAQAAFMIIQVITKSIRRLLNDSHVVTHRTTNDCYTSPNVSKYEPLPPPKYIKPPFRIIKNALCWTGLAPDRKFKIRNTLKVSILKRKAFDHTEDIPIISPSYRGEVHRTDCFTCWRGKTKDSEITFLFEVPDVSPSVSSVNMFTRSSRDSGEFEVWLDSDARKRIYPKTRQRQTVVVPVATGVRPGNHTLTVRITKDGNVAVLGIAVA